MFYALAQFWKTYLEAIEFELSKGRKLDHKKK